MSRATQSTSVPTRWANMAGLGGELAAENKEADTDKQSRSTAGQSGSLSKEVRDKPSPQAVLPGRVSGIPGTHESNGKKANGVLDSDASPSSEEGVRKSYPHQQLSSVS